MEAASGIALTGGVILGIFLALSIKRFVERAQRSSARLQTLYNKRRKLTKMTTAEHLELLALSPIADKKTAYQFLFDYYSWQLTAFAIAVLAVQIGTFIILYGFALDDAVRECEEYVKNRDTGELELRSERGSSSVLEDVGYGSGGGLDSLAPCSSSRRSSATC
eukprot:2211929-Prymnesium_polylepis.2